MTEASFNEGVLAMKAAMSAPDLVVWITTIVLAAAAVWLLYRWLRQDQTLNPGDPVEAQRDRERNNGY